MARAFTNKAKANREWKMILALELVHCRCAFDSGWQWNRLDWNEQFHRQPSSGRAGIGLHSREDTIGQVAPNLRGYSSTFSSTFVFFPVNSSLHFFLLFLSFPFYEHNGHVDRYKEDCRSKGQIMILYLISTRS